MFWVEVVSLVEKVTGNDCSDGHFFLLASTWETSARFALAASWETLKCC